MRFSIKAKCRDGEILHRRKTPEAALKKARECRKRGVTTSTSPRPKAETTIRQSLQIYPARRLRGDLLSRPAEDIEAARFDAAKNAARPERPGFFVGNECFPSSPRNAHHGSPTPSVVWAASRRWLRCGWAHVPNGQTFLPPVANAGSF